jgi:hypothetical protein
MFFTGFFSSLLLYIARRFRGVFAAPFGCGLSPILEACFPVSFGRDRYALGGSSRPLFSPVAPVVHGRGSLFDLSGSLASLFPSAFTVWGVFWVFDHTFLYRA